MLYKLWRAFQYYFFIFLEAVVIIGIPFLFVAYYWEINLTTSLLIGLWEHTFVLSIILLVFHLIVKYAPKDEELKD